jgi:ATP-dependent DNA helicase RecG
MLSDKELEALLHSAESDRVGRKAGKSSDKIRRAICAFANDLPQHHQPGYIFVGVSDDGICVNLPITDQLLRELADMGSDGGILPFPVIEVQKRTLNGCEVAVIQVQPSDSPPVRYKGIVWVSVGPSRRRARPEEERRLAESRRSHDLPFDRQPAHGTSLNDLDLVLFERDYLPKAVDEQVLAQNHRPVSQQLLSLHFLSPEGIPTKGAIIVLGKEPSWWIPGDYIQFRKVDGTRITDFTANAQQIAGPLRDVVNQLNAVFIANVKMAIEVTNGATDERQSDYPLTALRQIAYNAIMHRSYEGTNSPIRITWYEDRVEILSPGGPYGDVNERNFGQPGLTDYRNRFIAEAMGVMGLVQQFGMGIKMASDALLVNGNPPLEFNIRPEFITVTIRPSLRKLNGNGK